MELPKFGSPYHVRLGPEAERAVSMRSADGEREGRRRFADDWTTPSC
jgi:hypothetical protein